MSEYGPTARASDFGFRYPMYATTFPLCGITSAGDKFPGNVGGFRQIRAARGGFEFFVFRPVTVGYKAAMAERGGGFVGFNVGFVWVRIARVLTKPRTTGVTNDRGLDAGERVIGRSE